MSVQSIAKPDAAAARALPPGTMEQKFSAADGTAIRYAVCPGPNNPASGTVVLIPGRSEFIEKYAEVMADLRRRGYAVACMDVRGHGLSERPLANRQRHYQPDFAPAAADIRLLLEQPSVQTLPRPHILLAHSMGGHLALRFLHDNPDAVACAVLSAPMVDIRTTPFPGWLVRLLASLGPVLGYDEAYGFMQGDYGDLQRSHAVMDILTSDPARFISEHHWIARNPDLALGGVTFGWLRGALRSIDLINGPGYPEAVETPVLIVQAGRDRLVRNDLQTAFAARLPNGRFERIDDGRHELMMERDELRDTFWGYFDAFVAAHARKNGDGSG